MSADLSRGPVLLSVSVGTASFAFATCIVRFCVRKRISNDVGMDDYAIGVALARGVCKVVAFIGTVFSIIEGSSMRSSASALEFDFLGQPWFMMGATLAKISICLFFIRLVGSVKQWRILLSIQIFLMAIVNLAFSMTTNLQCRPLEKLWNINADGTCWDPNVQLNIGYFQGAFSVFWWFFLSLFPVMIARDLEMRRAMRWPFYFLSSLSLVAGILATVRTYEISKTTQPPVYTYDTFCATVLAILEQNFGIVAANVLPMGPLFSRRRPRINRAPSRVSGISNRSGHVGWVSSNDSTTNLKRSSALVIEGPRRASFETSASNRSHLDVDSRSLRDSWNVSDGWPRGIIKTVEVEVIEEDLADIEMAPGGRSSRISTLTVEHDWEAMLRAGPTPIPSRGPSRQD